MSRELSNILEIVDRSIFKAISDKLVAEGYAVDRSVPGILLDETAWRAAEQAIIDDKGFVVEIFGASTNHELTEKKLPRVVYTPQRLLPGDIGNAYGPTYELNTVTDTYEKTIGPLQTSNYLFKIGIHGKNAQEYRLMHSAIASVIAHKEYIPFYNDADKYIMLQQYAYQDDPDLRKGTKDGYYFYKVVDIYEGDDKVLDNLAPIAQIDMEGEIASGSFLTGLQYNTTPDNLEFTIVQPFLTLPFEVAITPVDLTFSLAQARYTQDYQSTPDSLSLTSLGSGVEYSFEHSSSDLNIENVGIGLAHDFTATVVDLTITQEPSFSLVYEFESTPIDLSLTTITPTTNQELGFVYFPETLFITTLGVTTIQDFIGTPSELTLTIVPPGIGAEFEFSVLPFNMTLSAALFEIEESIGSSPATITITPVGVSLDWDKALSPSNVTLNPVTSNIEYEISSNPSEVTINFTSAFLEYAISSNPVDLSINPVTASLLYEFGSNPSSVTLVTVAPTPESSSAIPAASVDTQSGITGRTITGGTYTYSDPSSQPEALQNPVFDRIYYDVNPANDILNEDGEIIEGMVLNLNAIYSHPQDISEGTRTIAVKHFSDNTQAYSGSLSTYTVQASDVGERLYLEGAPLDSQGNTGDTIRSAIGEIVKPVAVTPNLNPASGGTDIVTSSPIILTFDRIMYSSATGRILTSDDLSSLTLDVKETNSLGADVAGTWALTEDGEGNAILTFTPDATLSNGQVYYVEVSGIEDVNNTAYNNNYTFTTEAGSILEYVKINLLRTPGGDTGSGESPLGSIYHNDVEHNGNLGGATISTIVNTDNVDNGYDFTFTSIHTYIGTFVYSGVNEANTPGELLIDTFLKSGFSLRRSGSGGPNQITFTLSGLTNGQTWRAKVTGWSNGASYSLIGVDGAPSGSVDDSTYNPNVTPPAVITTADKVVSGGEISFTVEGDDSTFQGGVSAIVFERVS